MSDATALYARLDAEQVASLLRALNPEALDDALTLLGRPWPDAACPHCAQRVADARLPADAKRNLALDLLGLAEPAALRAEADAREAAERRNGDG